MESKEWVFCRAEYSNLKSIQMSHDNAEGCDCGMKLDFRMWLWYEAGLQVSLYLVICVWVRSVTEAIQAVEVVIVLVLYITSVFVLWGKITMTINVCRGVMRSLEPDWSHRILTLTGISLHRKSPNLSFPQSQRKFLKWIMRPPTVHCCENMC